MSAEDLEKYETEMELQLYREYRDVVGMFSYIVETERRFYLANDVNVSARHTDGDVYFDVTKDEDLDAVHQVDHRDRFEVERRSLVEHARDSVRHNLDRRAVDEPSHPCRRDRDVADRHQEDQQVHSGSRDGGPPVVAHRHGITNKPSRAAGEPATSCGCAPIGAHAITQVSGKKTTHANHITS
jgi:hypothetical protein